MKRVIREDEYIRRCAQHLIVVEYLPCTVLLNIGQSAKRLIVRHTEHLVVFPESPQLTTKLLVLQLQLLFVQRIIHASRTP